MKGRIADVVFVVVTFIVASTNQPDNCNCNIITCLIINRLLSIETASNLQGIECLPLLAVVAADDRHRYPKPEKSSRFSFFGDGIGGPMPPPEMR